MTKLTVDEWNERYPPGTEVLAWPWTRDSEPLVTRTRSPAWSLGGGDPVVAIDGRAGGIALSHIEPVEATSRHPRDGYVVEVWLGAEDSGDHVKFDKTRSGLVILEIYETYNVSGQHSGYHYQPYDLLRGQKMEVKTVGPMPLDRMREFAQRRVGEGFDWRRLR